MSNSGNLTYGIEMEIEGSSTFPAQHSKDKSQKLTCGGISSINGRTFIKRKN